MSQYEKSLGAPQIDKDEHVLVNGVNAKRVVASGYDGSNLQDISVNANGEPQVEITNDSIEQATGAAHTDLSIAVAGKDQDGNVQPLPLSDNAVAISGAKYSLQSYFEATTGWTESAGADNLETDVEHRGSGTKSLEFDKIAGNATAMISRAVTSLDMDEYSTHAIGIMNVYISDLTNVNYAFTRIGTDASHYCEWQFSGDIMVAGWNQLQKNITIPTTQVGNGYNLSAVTYIAFGVVFDDAANTLADIRTCGWSIKRVLETATVINADVAIDTAWVGIKDQNSNTRLDVESGTYKHLYCRQTDGTNRMPMMDAVARAGLQKITDGTETASVNASNQLEVADANTGAIKTALEIIDDWDESDRCKVNAILKPTTSGGLTIFRSIDLDESEEDVKTSAGQLYGYYIFNAAAATRYVKFYNATAANTTVGTTTPVLTIPLPAGAAANVEFTQGIAFSTAICAAATTGLADNDTGAPSANDVIVNIFYT